jgi:lysozyme
MGRPDGTLLPVTQQQAVVDAARTLLGEPYVWGGEGPTGDDCSGLCQWSYAQVGVSIPRTSQEQAQGGRSVFREELEPGDLIIYYPDASHVALYSGNGNVIEAATFGVPIEEVPIDSAGPYNQARRYLQEAPMTDTLYGVDVSNNNWPSIAACQTFMQSLPAQGYSWVEAKVSEGNYYSDPYWPATLAACHEIDMLVIGYHYVTTNDPASQVSTFVGNHGGSVVMLDFEANSGDINNFWAVVNAFNAAGVQVVLSYVPAWYWQQIGEPDLSQVPGLISSSYYERGSFGSVEYTDAGGDTGPGWNAYGNATPVIWQFTDGDIVDGYSVDGNAFKGTLDELTALLGGTVATPPTPPAPPTPPTNPPAIPKPADELSQISELWDQDLLRWAFLGGRTRAEALGAIGAALKINGFTDPLATP